MFDLGDCWVLRRYRDHEGAEHEAATIEHAVRPQAFVVADLS